MTLPRDLRRDLLAAASLFEGIDPDRAAGILDRCQPRRFARREVVFREGEPVDGLFLLAEGRVKLTQLTPHGKEVIMRLVAPGEVFAALAALPGSGRYPVSAIGLTAGTAAFWPRSLARRLADDEPALMRALLGSMAGQVRDFQLRLREVAAERVPVRLAALLDRLVSQAGRREGDGVWVDFPLTRAEIADMTGTTLFTVSRVLREWAERGWIELGRARVKVRRPGELRRLAAGG